uniref:J domain-containing protein n=1 Tax=Parerythrobacter lutipelagi TaxID=1964208 RepID=UPI0010F835A6|nr:J domain-containing protein [Parerythrobacter lutipelagi]
MVGARRSNDWGFPRWRGYGSSQDAVTVRLCDRHGCEEKGDCPAPKAPNTPERWYFCQKHAAEYNRKWDYFEGLDKAEKEARTKDEQTENAGYAEAQHYGWAGSGDGSRSADEMRALDVLELENDADFAAIKRAYRVKAKAVHPDVKPNDKEAAAEFQKLQLSYEVLKAAEERREWKG